jgi:hypothetical protein
VRGDILRRGDPLKKKREKEKKKPLGQVQRLLLHCSHIMREKKNLESPQFDNNKLATCGQNIARFLNFSTFLYDM